MSKLAQAYLAKELQRVIDYTCKEYNLNAFEAIGVLTHLANRLSTRICDYEEETGKHYKDEDEDEDEAQV